MNSDFGVIWLPDVVRDVEGVIAEALFYEDFYPAIVAILGDSWFWMFADIWMTELHSAKTIPLVHYYFLCGNIQTTEGICS